ncbi:MAG: cellobiose phosphorylase [Elusimicrobia bacterium]|nr:cellobiose phosphorylase [Elusimicrobiota bacterium]
MPYKVSGNRFIIENYNWETSFSNFFHGIAGKKGIPIWAFYISRAQCVCSLGVGDKNNQIMEFKSFNRALELVADEGFRTFVKINGKFYEPFRKVKSKRIKQTMTVSAEQLLIEEENENFKAEVIYYPVPEEPFAGFVRILNITPKRNSKIEILDGVPRILPYGMDMKILTTIARHIEGMMEVNLDKGFPFFRLKQTPADVETVGKIFGGNFYISLLNDNNPFHGNYFVDPFVVFEESEIYTTPWGFVEMPLSRMKKSKQILRNRTPCAFCGKTFNAKKGKTITIKTLIGNISSEKQSRQVLSAIKRKNFFEEKRRRNSEIINEIKNISFTKSADEKFDEYVKHNFLDNVIRGGLPVVFETAQGKTAFYLYSRQNGDLERDYHFFVLEPCYYSQGTGHYRSVNQNRRMDVFFFPETLDLNIKLFVNLIQTDGYNPLEVNKVSFSVKNKNRVKKILSGFSIDKKIKKKILEDAFTPGEVLMALENAKVKNSEKILRKIIKNSTANDCGGIHEGFWVDHWLYNIDLIETFMGVWPDKLDELLLKDDYYFYDNPDVVKRRAEKYVLRGGRVYQERAVWRISEKLKNIASRKKNPTMMRTKYGKGEIYRTNLFVKLLVMILNRLGTIDAEGTGIEMEADKPGWNDSMNGLPGICGSSLCQMLELERILILLDEMLPRVKARKIKVFVELGEFLKKIEKVVRKRIDGKMSSFEYWDASHTIKERYREKTIFGIDGKEEVFEIKEIHEKVKLFRKFISESIRKNRKKIFKKGIPLTYFENQATKYKVLKKEKDKTYVMPLAFRQKPLPLFLEGPVHYIRVHPEEAGQIWKAVRNSNLFDKKLKMYKVCESLEKAPFEIGRVKAWGSGWIENESIYTHMEFKYLLEILKSGLYREFFYDIKTMLPPYFNPSIYGRSIFENVSFIVSSAFPDEKMHGRGLQPRLSGVTSEMINIWCEMVAGKNPFFIDADGKLAFKLSPKISGEFFKKDTKTFSFKLFKTLFTYKNPDLRDTWKCSIKQYTLYTEEGRMVVEADKLNEDFALKIREGKIPKIEVLLK